MSASSNTTESEAEEAPESYLTIPGAGSLPLMGSEVHGLNRNMEQRRCSKWTGAALVMGTLLMTALVCRPEAWFRASVASSNAEEPTSEALPKLSKSLEVKDGISPFLFSTTKFNFTNYPGENSYTTNAPSTCGQVQDNSDYMGHDLRSSVEPSADACCQRCQADSLCVAWVWGKERGQASSDQCYLKGGVPENALVSSFANGFVSGKKVDPAAAQGIGFGLNPFGPVGGGGAGWLHAIMNAPNTLSGMLRGVGARAGPVPVVPGVPLGDAAAQSLGSIPFAPITIPPSCAIQLLEQNTEYPGNDLETFEQFSRPEECCAKCQLETRCVAWTFNAGNCFLKGTQPRLQLTKTSATGSYSGRNSAVSSVVVIERSPGQSLLCWALAIPNSYEKALLAYQYEQGASLFGCDEYAVYSNEDFHIVPNFKTTMVDVDLNCQRGGEFGTALNTDIFLKVWDKVLTQNRWRLHDWTVKVDPDAVFLPDRLRSLLTRHVEEGRGVYINNCKLGLHGPIEVFSRNAVQTFWSGRQSCIDHFNAECQGPCKWGEDMFIDQCLSKVLQVRRDPDNNVLLEDHCNPPADWRSCTSPATAAYHPFKAVAEYQQCLVNAHFPLRR